MLTQLFQTIQTLVRNPAQAQVRWRRQLDRYQTLRDHYLTLLAEAAMQDEPGQLGQLARQVRKVQRRLNSIRVQISSEVKELYLDLAELDRTLSQQGLIPQWAADLLACPHCQKLAFHFQPSSDPNAGWLLCPHCLHLYEGISSEKVSSTSAPASAPDP